MEKGGIGGERRGDQELEDVSGFLNLNGAHMGQGHS